MQQKLLQQEVDLSLSDTDIFRRIRLSWHLPGPVTPLGNSVVDYPAKQAVVCMMKL